MQKQTVSAIVSALIKADDALMVLAQTLCEAVYPLKYEREILAELGAAIIKELPKAYHTKGMITTLANACAIAGICRKGATWLINGMGVATPSAVCQALDKVHGNVGKRKQEGGRPTKSPVEKLAAQAAKLSSKDRKDLIKLLQAM